VAKAALPEPHAAELIIGARPCYACGDGFAFPFGEITAPSAGSAQLSNQASSKREPL
jgi:hypothetical protein